MAHGMHVPQGRVQKGVQRGRSMCMAMKARQVGKGPGAHKNGTNVQRMWAGNNALGMGTIKRWKAWHGNTATVMGSCRKVWNTEMAAVNVHCSSRRQSNVQEGVGRL